MSTPDVTTHNQILRKDDMELLTRSDRVPERLRRLERAMVDISSAPGGVNDKNYIHTQTPLAAVWNVVHNLGKFPAVDVVDSGGTVVMPDVRHLDLNTLTVTFGAATSGKVYCN